MDFVFDQVDSTACSHCGGSVDVTGRTAFSSIECPNCQSKVRVPAKLGALILSELLGTGAAGVVYKALDTTLQRQVAVKILRGDSGDARKVAEATLAEARALAAINHPHVVHVHTIGIRHNQPFIVMELLMGGGKLHVMLKEGWIADEQRGLQIAIDVADGLKAALASGLLHRDVKPANILFNNEGSAKVLDFSAVSAPTSTDDNKRIVVGTPYYISPEAARGLEVDFRSDLYSLGATLFHLLTGKPAFDGETSNDVMRARLKKAAPDIREVNASITPGTAAVVARMLATDVNDRQASYEELIAELQAALNALLTGNTGGEGSLAGLHAAVAQREVVPMATPRRTRSSGPVHAAPKKGLNPLVYGGIAAVVVMGIVIAVIAGGGGGKSKENDANKGRGDGQIAAGTSSTNGDEQPRMGEMPKPSVPPPPVVDPPKVDPAKDGGTTPTPPADPVPPVVEPVPPVKPEPPKPEPPKPEPPKPEPPKPAPPKNPMAPAQPPPGPRGEGFRVVTVRPVTGGIASFDEAEQLLDGKRPGKDVTIDQFPTINFIDPEQHMKGNMAGGHYDGNRPFPGNTNGNDDHFAVRITTRVYLPAGGSWTFAARSDDCVRFSFGKDIVQLNDKPGVAHDVMVTVNDVPGPGYLELEVLYYEGGGDAELELFAAKGGHNQFNKDAFRLVGDTAGGGLYCYQPIKQDGVELAKAIGAAPVTPAGPVGPTGPPPPKLDAYVPAPPRSYTEWRLYDAVPRDGFVLVPRFAEWHVWAKPEPVDASWTAPNFTGAGWEMANGSLGYGSPALRTQLPDMKGKFAGVYLRAPFKIADPAGIGELSLAARYNDAIAVYINGKEVYRSQNLEGSADKAKVKEAAKPSAQPVAVDLKDARKHLVKGINIIAIECHNHSADDISFVLDPFLFADAAPKPTLATNKVLTNAHGWSFKESTVKAGANGLDFLGKGATPRLEHGPVKVEGTRRPQAFLVVFALTKVGGRAKLEYTTKQGAVVTKGDDEADLVAGQWVPYVFQIRLAGEIQSLKLTMVGDKKEMDIRWIRLQSDKNVAKTAGSNVLKEWQFAPE
ncbi:MAG: protein kinase [Phycisphaeraceae bacterium]